MATKLYQIMAIPKKCYQELQRSCRLPAASRLAKKVLHPSGDGWLLAIGIGFEWLVAISLSTNMTNGESIGEKKCHMFPTTYKKA